MQTSIVTSKGQVVIPLALRKRLGIESGTLLRMYEENGEIRIVPVTHSLIDTNIGFARTKGKLMKSLAEEKNFERER